MNCLNSFSTSIEPTDFTTLEDFSFTPTYNKTTRTFQVVYVVPSGTSSNILINATKFDSLGTTQICSDTLASSSGTLTCTAPTSFGNSSAVFRVYKDGVLVNQNTVSLQENPSDIYGSSFIFIIILLYLTLFGLGISSDPNISGFIMIIGAILAISLNLIGTGSSSFIGYGATVLWIIVAIVIVMVKGANR